ncbi:MAG: hypothetical protein AVDCRST_MAG73-3361, partial [uncultured Thermomicrobiales bacterium]
DDPSGPASDPAEGAETAVDGDHDPVDEPGARTAGPDDRAGEFVRHAEPPGRGVGPGSTGGPTM